MAEFTYWAEGNPRLAGATVTVLDIFDGRKVLYTGVSNSAGLVSFPTLREGNFELRVSADDHNSKAQPVVVRAGADNEAIVFLERAAVKYTWSVTPTEIEDEYSITVEADFTTNVPTPGAFVLAALCGVPPDVRVAQLSQLNRR